MPHPRCHREFPGLVRQVTDGLLVEEVAEAYGHIHFFTKADDQLRSAE